MSTGSAEPPANSVSKPARDFGQVIAFEYWRKTPHVYEESRRGEGFCAYCGVAKADGPHIEAPPEPPKPTIVSVALVDVSRGESSGLRIVPSCGHAYTSHGTPKHNWPKAGDVYNCMNCSMAHSERVWPGLPDAVAQRIADAKPKCPTCNGDIERVEIRAVRTHQVFVDVDHHTGELTVTSEPYNTVELEPEHGIDPRRGAAGTLVTCANHHEWYEPRFDWRGDKRWAILPPPESSDA